jgi:hypothetical protein
MFEKYFQKKEMTDMLKDPHFKMRSTKALSKVVDGDMVLTRKLLKEMGAKVVKLANNKEGWKLR